MPIPIKLYNPDIIICCGTGDIVSKLSLVENSEKIELTSNGIKYSKASNCLMIRFKHPQARRDKKLLFDTLMKSIVELKKDSTS